MLNIVLQILYIVVMIAIILGVYALCKKFVFPKIRINKFIPLAVAIVLFIIQIFGVVKNQWGSLAITVIIIVSFLWFMDIHQTGGPKIDKKIVIKPKAKPNRAKHLKK
ncbi:hypothetical protein [Clostridium sp. Ade.TY]|uniref:hypothetical protein n=1 Tax=Clostridium sp. Ade.TY TaxID=1391647 RepID=UPI0004178DA8|nr:hypothetical protein [Clostridium sp. Ade.TY]